MYDLLIKGGLIIDGTGNEPYYANLAISGGKISLITNEAPHANEIIRAEGLVVAPGFIDSHSHSDRHFISHPDQREKAEQGITYSIAGQCGSSAAPYRSDTGIVTAGEFLNKVRDIPQGSGASMFVGFNSVRSAVMGAENRAPTKDELKQMQELVREAMRAGALGLSLGLLYVPGCYATTDEVVAVASVVREFDGLLASHIRSESDTFLESVEEYIHIIKATGCRAVFSHHKASGKPHWGEVKKSIAMIEEAISEGYDIYLDVYPYVASHTGLSSTYLPNRFHKDGMKSVLEILEDRNLLDIIKASRFKRNGTDYSWTLITYAEGHPEYVGKNLNEICEMRGDSDPVESAFAIIKETGNRSSACYFTMCEEDVEYVMAHPRAMICTDSASLGDNTSCHPRLRGSFPRVLGRYVRERGVTTLAEMIRKMTSLPARVYKLSTKGEIKCGMDADICIFNPNTIIDRADFASPTLKNEGLDYVIISGRVVVKDGVYNGVRAACVR